MAEKNITGSRPGNIEPGKNPDSVLGGSGERRPYSPPCILSSEPLELAAGTCEGTGPIGKGFPPCTTLLT